MEEFAEPVGSGVLIGLLEIRLLSSIFDYATEKSQKNAKTGLTNGKTVVH